MALLFGQVALPFLKSVPLTFDVPIKLVRREVMGGHETVGTDAHHEPDIDLRNRSGIHCRSSQDT